MARHSQWLSRLAVAATSPANPLANTQTVNPDGSVAAGGSTAMSDFTTLEAESMDAALAAARSCPFVEIGGSLVVSEFLQKQRLI